MDSRGGHNRKSINQKFFIYWSPDMAYVLGLIYADGTIEDARKSSRTCYLAITSKDKSLLLQVRHALSSSHNLYVKRPSLNIFPGNKLYLCSKLYILRVGSRNIYEDLKSFGLSPRKSLILKFPTVPHKYLRFFIRGYFDGDGSITVSIEKSKKTPSLVTVFTCGSEKFLKSINNILTLVSGTTAQKIHYQGRAFRLRYRKRDSLKFLNFIYKNPLLSPYLNRKYVIYQNYLKGLN